MQNAVPKTECWNTLQVTDRCVKPLSQALVHSRDPTRTFPWLRMC